MARKAATTGTTAGDDGDAVVRDLPDGPPDEAGLTPGSARCSR
jgi:hypothetical protein